MKQQQRFQSIRLRGIYNAPIHNNSNKLVIQIQNKMNKQKMIEFVGRGILFYANKLSETTQKDASHKVYRDSYDFYTSVLKILTEKKEDKKFYYNNSFQSFNEKIEMEIDDTIKILPSENCVTNSDTIKYDERIDSTCGLIKSIHYDENEIVISAHDGNRLRVHPTWLKLIKK